MPRKKKMQKPWQHKFCLSPDNPDDVALHEFLLGQAENGKAAEWLRDVARNAVLHGDYSSTTLVPRKSEVKTPVLASSEPVERPFTPVPKPNGAKKHRKAPYDSKYPLLDTADDEPEYVDIEGL